MDNSIELFHFVGNTIHSFNPFVGNSGTSFLAFVGNNIQLFNASLFKVLICNHAFLTKSIYSRTSVAPTVMARLPWLVRTHA